MQVENLTQSTFFLGRPEYQLDPGETLTVPDSVYDVDDAVAQAINQLDSDDKVTVTSAPAGYPRVVSGGGVSGEAAIMVIIDGGGAAITTGLKHFIEVPFAATITAARVVADQVGDIVVDIWKDTYANFPPTNADSICGSAEPELAAAQKSEDTTLTGWTTELAKGEWLAFNVDSVATVTRVTVSLSLARSY